MKASKTSKENSQEKIENEKRVWQHPSITELPIRQTAQGAPLPPPQPS